MKTGTEIESYASRMEKSQYRVILIDMAYLSYQGSIGERGPHIGIFVKLAISLDFWK